MESVSGYFRVLAADSKVRYASKVAGVGLKHDPYAIPNESWVHLEPDAFPDLAMNSLLYHFPIIITVHCGARNINMAFLEDSY